MARALSRRALSTAPWLGLALVLMPAGTVGVATLWGAAPGRGTLLDVGGGELVRSRDPRGGIVREEAVGAERRVWVKQQWMRRMLRAAEGERGERGEQHGSSDRMDLHSAAAAAPSAAVACAAPSAAAIAAAVAAAAAADGADSGSGSGSVWEGLSTLQPHVGTATVANASGSSRPFHRVLASGAAAVVAAPSQPLTLPAECRDGSAEKAVVVTTFRYDQVNFPIDPVHPVYPYEVILNNTCQQRAISRLTINIVRKNRFRSYVLIPRLQFIGYGKDERNSHDNYQFRVLPPLGAPNDSVIIPPGAILKFNTTTQLLHLSITVIAATFSP
ncbi:hypothetical protein CLOP_g16967 [Closterium sp. NIES-67]|nr:hypothetical protein CLOP_g16967 [Closterium sp. NIES-67]